LLLKSCILLIFWTLFGLGLSISKKVWTVVGLGLSISKKVWTVVGLGLNFKNSGLDLDRKV